MGLWENAEENQPLIGCLIISLTHSLVIEMRAILIIQEAKYKLVYLTRLFIASLTLRVSRLKSRGRGFEVEVEVLKSRSRLKSRGRG